MLQMLSHARVGSWRIALEGMRGDVVHVASFLHRLASRLFHSSPSIEWSLVQPPNNPRGRHRGNAAGHGAICVACLLQLSHHHSA